MRYEVIKARQLKPGDNIFFEDEKEMKQISNISRFKVTQNGQEARKVDVMFTDNTWMLYEPNRKVIVDR